MFERFTERAREVVVLAQAAAREMGHNYIGTEHILVGLIDEEDGNAAQVLADLGVSRYGVVQGIEARVESGEQHENFQIPFVPNAKIGFEEALRIALSYGHNYIGTEHLLLGFAKNPDNVFMSILRDDFRINEEQLRKGINQQLMPEQKDARKRREERKEEPIMLQMLNAYEVIADPDGNRQTYHVHGEDDLATFVKILLSGEIDDVRIIKEGD